MPCCESQGVRIHYQVEGSGSPLLLHHGFGHSLEDWYDFGYVAALRGDYRLILLDARGHGASDKPHAPEAYSIEGRVADVVAVLDAVGADTAHFWGYSMGGKVGYNFGTLAPARARSLVLGGADPDERAAGSAHWLAPLVEPGMDAYVAAAGPIYGRWLTPALRGRLLANDPAALLAWLAAGERPGLKGLLSAVALPCLLYAGDADAVHADARAASSALPRARFVSLPELDHISAFCRVDLVMPHVAAFLASDGQLNSQPVTSSLDGRPRV